MSSVTVASVGQIRPAKRKKTSISRGTFKEKIELKKYSRGEYDSISIPESGKALETRVAAIDKKQTIVAMRAYLHMKKPKLITKLIHPLT